VSNYRAQLSSQLHGIPVPAKTLLCTNTRCQDMNHIQAINDYAYSITDSCITAAESTLPHTCSRQQGHRVPGWAEHVQPQKKRKVVLAQAVV